MRPSKWSLSSWVSANVYVAVWMMGVARAWPGLGRGSPPWTAVVPMPRGRRRGSGVAPPLVLPVSFRRGIRRPPSRHQEPRPLDVAGDGLGDLGGIGGQLHRGVAQARPNALEGPHVVGGLLVGEL